MEIQSKLAALVDLAEELGISVRRVPLAGESAEHPGGALVKLKGREMFFLDPTAAPADQVAALGAALKGRPEIEDRFLPPEIRDAIDAKE